MRQTILCALAWAAILSAAPSTRANDWITAPSYYTHDPQTGERVRQYSPIGPFYVYPRADYVQSGYRHIRSSIRAGGSVDHLHIVEQWGPPARPYGEWRFPFRPHSVPYHLWGPPWLGFGGNAPYAGYPHTGPRGPRRDHGGRHPVAPWGGHHPSKPGPGHPPPESDGDA